MDIRTPSHELVIAYRIVRTRQRIARNDSGWALSRAGIMALAGVAKETEPEIKLMNEAGEGTTPAPVEDDVIFSELVEIDAVLEKTKWLLESKGPEALRKRVSEVSVGELLIRDPDWNETERATV